ncbi:uncharacterized protein PRCAT00001327001 [Priceomyces carsonii]|uniref:uncharacterized protein n=1 Tax=Priceomyces carsonii TaxID=28549 RepID=UPI002ED7BDAC|nr:unnamed protein product [Priceomyces carsonii]
MFYTQPIQYYDTVAFRSLIFVNLFRMKTEVLQMLENLSLEDNEFEGKLKLFLGLEDINDIRAARVDVIKYSRNPDIAKILLQILQMDPDVFLEGLRRLGDTHGVILVNVLNFDNDKLKLIMMTVKRKIEQGHHNFVEIKFYLSIYCSLISNFEFIVSEDLNLFLSYLNPIYSIKYPNEFKEVTATALLVMLKYYEKDRSTALDTIKIYLEVNYRHAEITLSEYLNSVKIIEELFPVDPIFTASIYTDDNCKQLVLTQIKKLSNQNLEDPEAQLILKETLKMVGSSCIIEQCRQFNSKEYLDLLKVGLKFELNTEIQLLSTLDLVKLWNFGKQDQENNNDVKIADLIQIVFRNLRLRSLAKPDSELELCVEILAYLTLVPIVRIQLREEKEIINMLTNVLCEANESIKTDSNQQSLIYGLLVCFENLSRLPDPLQSQDKRTISALKQVSTPASKEMSNNVTERPDSIMKFNKSLLLDQRLVQIVLNIKVNFISRSNDKGSSIISHLINIIYLISCNQEKVVRQELVKQGAVNVAFGFLINSSTVDDKTGKTKPKDLRSIDVRLNAIRSLMKILISVQPSLVFKKFDIRSSVPFIVECLGPDLTQYSGNLFLNDDVKYLYEKVTSLDKYEALLALTNLAADGSDDLKKLIIKRCFEPYLDNFMFETSIPQVQLATWELICNLIVEPSLLQKFFDFSEGKPKRLTILIKLLHAEDESLQITIAGLLANATSEFELISRLLVEHDDVRVNLTDIMTDILKSQEENSNLILRISYILLNMVYSAANLDGKLDYYRNNAQLKLALRNTIQNKNNEEITEIISDILRVIE